MKSLLEFKQNAVKVRTPKKEWEDLYQKLIEKFKEWGLEHRVDSFNDYKWEDITERFNENFERVFISELITHVLQINKTNSNLVWYNIFNIKCTSSVPKSYHGSDSNNLVETYEFQLSDKRDVLNRLGGEKVFEHYEEVKTFMDQHNDTYMKLFEIKRLFPITIENV